MRSIYEKNHNKSTEGVNMRPQQIKGNKMLLESPVATAFYTKIHKQWPSLIKNKKAILFLPCASTKPTHLSRSHCMMSDVTRIHSESLLIVIISESLVFQPYTTTSFPNYDYPPEELRNSATEMAIMMDRIKSFKEITLESINLFYCGGWHHLDLLENAGFQNIKRFQYGNGGVMDGKRIAHACYEELKKILPPPVYRTKISCDHIDPYNISISYQIIKRLY